MRTKRPREKTRERTPVPNALRAFLADVLDMIRQGDEAATIESDDLLQCECAYGGLLEDGGDRFGFTYFPGPGIQNKWELLLRAVDIEHIANGEIETLDLWCCTAPGCNWRFSEPDDTCFHHDWVEDNSADGSTSIR